MTSVSQPIKSDRSLESPLWMARERAAFPFPPCVPGTTTVPPSFCPSKPPPTCPEARGFRVPGEFQAALHSASADGGFTGSQGQQDSTFLPGPSTNSPAFNFAAPPLEHHELAQKVWASAYLSSAPRLRGRWEPARPCSRRLPADRDKSQTLYLPFWHVGSSCPPLILDHIDPVFGHSSCNRQLVSVSWGHWAGCSLHITSFPTSAWQNPTHASMAHVSPPLGSLSGNSLPWPGPHPYIVPPTQGLE